MYRILALAPAGAAFCHFQQNRPNLAPAKFLAGFPDFIDFRTADYLQLKVMKQV